MLVNIGGRYFNPDLIFSVYPVDDDEDSDQSIILSAGADPVAGGCLVDLPCDDVVAIINQSAYLHLANQLEESARGERDPSENNDEVVVDSSGREG